VTNADFRPGVEAPPEAINQVVRVFGPGPGRLIHQTERKSRRVAPVHRAQRRPVHANARESGRTGDCQCFGRRPEIFINYRPRRVMKNPNAEENTRENARSRSRGDARAYRDLALVKASARTRAYVNDKLITLR
jgi:hypothetical protein